VPALYVKRPSKPTGQPVRLSYRGRGIAIDRRFPDVLALQSGRGDLHGTAITHRCRHQSSEQALDAPIDVVVEHAAGLLASPVVRLPVREGLAGRGRPRSGPAVLDGRPAGSGHGLLAKFLEQYADLGFGVAAVAAEGLEEG
jgi:hypothetical protein